MFLAIVSRYTGNVFQITSQAVPPFPSYAKGRFSDGDIWIDRLSASLGVTSTPWTEVLLGGVIPTQGINFAYGGATTGFRNNLDNPPGPIFLGLQEQIEQFTNAFPVTADPNALYVIWAGGNDYLPSLTNESFEPETNSKNPIENLDTAINSLFARGARHFLIPNLPDVGQIPFIKNNPAAPELQNLSEPLNQRINEFNTDLENKLNELSGTLAGIKITSVDVKTLFNRAIAGELDFTVVDTPCLNQSTGEVCDNPDDYLFWDLTHPTQKSHQLLGDLAVASLEAQYSVPKPALPWGIFTFSCLSLGVKRKRQI